MSQSTLNKYSEEAAPILESFLATLLRKDLTIQFGTPEKVERSSVDNRTNSHFTVNSKGGGANGFGIQLEPNWIPLISTGMLGQTMAPEDEGVADLAGEIISQGFGALRNKISVGSSFPEAYFDSYDPGSTPPAEALSNALWQVPFELEVEGEKYAAIILLSAESVESLEEDNAEAPAEPEEPIAVSPVNLPDLGRESIPAAKGKNFELLAEVELNVTVELGRRRIPLSEVLVLTKGSVVELEKLVGEPLEVFANGRLIAEGEAVVIDEQFGVRITTLASAKNRAKAFA